MIRREFLEDSNRFLPIISDSEIADRFAERLINNACDTADQNLIDYWTGFLSDQRAKSALYRIFGNSPFLSGIIVSDPYFSKALFSKGTSSALNTCDADLSSIISENCPTLHLKTKLRKLRKKIILTCAVGDCLENWSVKKVTRVLSDFADNVLSISIRHFLAVAQKKGEINLNNPREPDKLSGFICLGMGKLGARELNFSSDIDLIFLYDPNTLPYVGKQSKQEFCSKLVRDIISMIEDRTPDGFVFRVDLRLRPDPGAFPAAISTLAAETYYESAGQNWERAAMIKARPVAGDLDAGQLFLDKLRPFIWRKNLDFAAIDDIHSIKRQISSGSDQDLGEIKGHNIKLGRGGIREIEFFVQTQQLIWGGRNHLLRTSSTCESLVRLSEVGQITPRVSRELADAYSFLRLLEHRLQMIDDQQTHEIPNNREKILALSKFCGFESDRSFEIFLKSTLKKVKKHYGSLFEHAPSLATPGSLVFTGSEDHPDTLKTLSNLGFIEPSKILAIIRGWHHGRIRALRSNRSRELLTKILPALIMAISKTLEPDKTFLRLDIFLSGLPAGVQILSLMYSHQSLLELLSEILGSAPVLSEELSRHPILLDAVLSTDFFEPPPDLPAMHRILNKSLDQARDFEDILDITRRETNDRIFQIGVSVLRNQVKPLSASKDLTNVAETALGQLFMRVLENFTNQYGIFPGSEMAILALGKLGGKEITFGSDLDLLFVYRAGPQEVSSGLKPLNSISYFSRLAQRYIGALSAPTGQGRLYEVDLRLRPSGNSGPIASSIESFLQYQLNDAWTWEHMALTRTRIIISSSEIKRSLETSVRKILTQNRDPKKLLNDVASMRSRIVQNRKQPGPWDMKNMRGGLIDIEFIAQYLQLKYSHLNEKILSSNTKEAITKLGEAGFLETPDVRNLLEALDLWHNLQGILRLTITDGTNWSEPNTSIYAKIIKSCGAQNMDHLQSLVKKLSADCYKVYQKIIEKPAKKIG